VYATPEAGEPSLRVDVEVDLSPGIEFEQAIADEWILGAEAQAEDLVIRNTHKQRAGMVRLARATDTSRIRILEPRPTAFDARRLTLVLKHGAHRKRKPAVASGDRDEHRFGREFVRHFRSGLPGRRDVADDLDRSREGDRLVVLSAEFEVLDISLEDERRAVRQRDLPVEERRGSRGSDVRQQ
jgi:hypothetical protein